MDLGQIDSNAQNGIIRGTLLSLSVNLDFQYLVLDLNNLGKMFVQWRNKKTIAEMMKDSDIPENNQTETLEKIRKFKKAILGNIFTDTTIFGMRKNPSSPVVIFDGIHRAIAIQRAYSEDKTIKTKLLLRLGLFENEQFEKLDDYIMSIR